jgi:hypothetical protein
LAIALRDTANALGRQHSRGLSFRAPWSGAFEQLGGRAENPVTERFENVRPLPIRGEVQMSDTHIEIDGGEVVDISSNATPPEALRRAAAYLRRQSEKPIDPRFPAPPQPEPARANISIDDLLVRRIDDPPCDEAAQRTAAAHMEILKALELERQQTEQRRNQNQTAARAKVRQTALGRLLGDTRHG